MNRLSRLFLPDADRHPHLYAKRWQQWRGKVETAAVILTCIAAAPVVFAATYLFYTLIFAL